MGLIEKELSTMDHVLLVQGRDKCKFVYVH